MPIDPRLRVAWERFLWLIPIFAVLAIAGLWLGAGLTLAPLEAGGWGPWWLLPVIGTLLTALMTGVVALVAHLARTRPTLVNLPAKALFVALPVEARTRVARRVGQLLLGIAVVVDLVLLVVIRDTGRIARGELAGLPLWKGGVLVGLLALWLVVGFLRIRQLIRKEAAAAAGGPPVTLG